ncbi:hypothetical protein INS49_002955 [Diaporthe citri]|uniref:uncharacterized protein n=1 Tax=Diaporthe citri TaxID=83186 RepID=UPI001C824805|nr:uncharacterized protein INS49_002955 [Diaporthe citri]KAG6368741.1 hypothetical protein INS49_002955 [Diaporthe citri]
MQTPGGSRDARCYDFVGLDLDYKNAIGRRKRRYDGIAVAVCPRKGSTGYAGPSAQPGHSTRRLMAINYSSIDVARLDLDLTRAVGIPVLMFNGPVPDVQPPLSPFTSSAR